MPYPAFCSLFTDTLQIIRILNRFLIYILHQTGIAAKRICNDGLFLLFHGITPTLLFHTNRILPLPFPYSSGKIRVNSGGSLCLTLP